MAALQVSGVNAFGPTVTEFLIEPAPCKLQPPLIEETAELIRVRHPDHHRCRIRDGAKAGLAFAKLFFSQPAFSLLRHDQPGLGPQGRKYHSADKKTPYHDGQLVPKGNQVGKYILLGRGYADRPGSRSKSNWHIGYVFRSRPKVTIHQFVIAVSGNAFMAIKHIFHNRLERLVAFHHRKDRFPDVRLVWGVKNGPVMVDDPGVSRLTNAYRVKIASRQILEIYQYSDRSLEFTVPKDRDMKGDRVDSFNSFKYIADDRPMIPQELAYVLLMGKVSSDFVACRIAIDDNAFFIDTSDRHDLLPVGLVVKLLIALTNGVASNDYIQL